MFIHQAKGTGDAAGSTAGDITWSGFPVDDIGALTDLALGCRESDDGTLHGVLRYNENLLERESAERMVQDLARVIRAVAEDPGCCIDEIELSVGAAGGARGYLGLVGPTAEHFLPDPFTVGREDSPPGADDLVDPGELRVAMEKNPLVAEAFVRTGEPREVDLLVVLADPAPLDAMDRLHDCLDDLLPLYVESVGITVLDSLPRTPGGDVAVDRLPAPAPRTASGEPPKDELETVVAEIFKDLIDGVETVGRHDNFFDIGGHSLIAMRVKFGVRERLGLELEQAEFYRNPTVAGTAALLRNRQPASPAASSGGVLVGSGAVEGVLSPAQEA
ncbi:phosphopantetheine-binding protein, partial [Streptomyces camponoticapitis]|uniref:phosphopantetheine-binding protein n=1 Tax=Streptomyces camponoticapitis TaxID=1616125 RepID=UPI001668FA44